MVALGLVEVGEHFDLRGGWSAGQREAEGVRDLLAETEAGLAVLDQEEQIIGQLARLVALDAAALSAELEAASPAAGQIPRAAPADALELFLAR